MSDVKIDIKSLSYEQLNLHLNEFGEKPFRTKQIFKWLHEKNILSFNEMTNLPKNLIEKLNNNFFLTILKTELILKSKIDNTIKFLFKLSDGQCIESVLMEYSYGNTICISSQAGCAMGCKFCASTIGGKVRNLSVGEMLSQIYFVERETSKQISSIVLMGTGEPLDNFDNLLCFLNIINDKNGRAMSHRHITISTCGIVSKIYEFADKKFQVTLTISLHASCDKTRNEIMPINKKYNISQLIDACKYYFKATGRRISFEYALISNLNDNENEALELCKILKGFPCHVNLIPVNKVEENSFFPPNKNNIYNFQKTLEKNNITATVRRTLGSDINAACGQLRRKNSKV